MDDIETRLKETSEQCFTCFSVWQKDKKSVENREALQDSIHELRKVASRLEIELALSDRTELAKKPIPIPTHRDASRRSAENGNDGNEGNQRGGRSGGGRRRSSKKNNNNDDNAGNA